MSKLERRIGVAQKSPGKAIGRVWRRLHGGDIIAEVVSHHGIGFWRASAYRIRGRASEAAYTGRAFSLLTEAREGADELARREFGHECLTGTCGQWLPWQERNPPDHK